MGHLGAFQLVLLNGFDAGVQLVFIAGLLLLALVGQDLLIIAVIDLQAFKIAYVVDHQIAFGSVDHSSSVADPDHGSRELGHLAVSVADGDILLGVQAFVCIGAVGIDPGDVIPKDHGGKVEQTYAGIHERTAAQRRFDHPAYLAYVVAQIGIEHGGFPDGPLPDHTQDLLIKRQEADPHGFGAEQLLLPGQGKELLRLSCVQGKGLFAKDVLPMLQRQLYIVIVLRVGRCDVDQVRFRIGDRFLIRPVGLLKVIFLGKLFGPFIVPGSHAADSGRRSSPDGLRHESCHISCSQDHNIQFTDSKHNNLLLKDFKLYIQTKPHLIRLTITNGKAVALKCTRQDSNLH